MLSYKLGQAKALTHLDGTAPRESGIAVLQCDGKTLTVTAVLEDSDIFNTAEKENERTWTTGDALEFFFQPARREDYFEFHVTPPNARTLQLHIPSVEKLRIVPFEEQIFESGMKGRVEVLDGEWKARMEIPLSALGNVTLAGSRFTICRYNYWQNEEEPELTSITDFMHGTFHSPNEWFTIAE